MTKSYNDYERHGMKGTRTYMAWANMLGRCRTLESPKSVNHGQRGISFDPAWRRFSVFYADMGECPEGKSLERENNEGDYTKENCKWATRSEQALNRRLFVNNTSGLAGVTWTGETVTTRVYHNKLRQKLYHGKDFFEACCIRKSWENSHV